MQTRPSEPHRISSWNGPRLNRRGRWSALLLAVAVSLAGVSTGCQPGGGRADAGDLLVFAASDLNPALPELEDAFRAAGGPAVRFVVGSSGNLAAQIENGAPADVYLAANQHFVDRLIERGVVTTQSRTVYAVGRLVLVTRPGVPLPESVAGLGDRGYRVVAIANPEHAPYGIAAREALVSAGIWEAVSPRLVLAENVAHAFRLVETGSADAGLVAVSLLPPEGPGRALLVDDVLHDPLRQTGGAVATSRNLAAANHFLTFLADSAAQEILRRYGFEPVQ
jgi:molybdate transport system substrate-binding protein